MRETRDDPRFAELYVVVAVLALVVAFDVAVMVGALFGYPEIALAVLGLFVASAAVSLIVRWINRRYDPRCVELSNLPDPP